MNSNGLSTWSSHTQPECGDQRSAQWTFHRARANALDGPHRGCEEPLAGAGSLQGGQAIHDEKHCLPACTRRICRILVIAVTYAWWVQWQVLGVVRSDTELRCVLLTHMILGLTKVVPCFEYHHFSRLNTT